jgi:beta-glucanase (GH16 family)
MTNYFGKGDTSTYDRELWVPVSAPTESFHTYTIQWAKESTNWLIDGKIVRTVNYNDAQGGARYPQTPMNIRVGIWAGGAPTNAQGTIDWAGGPTDYSQGPYSMYIKSITVKNANPAESYTWSDKSGSSDSIKFTGSNAVSSRSTTSEAATSSSSEAASSTDSPSTTTEGTSSAATTLATKTSGSSSAESTAASSSAAGASSSGASPSGSSGPGSGSSTETGASSSSPSGSGSSTSASASASASPSFNAAASAAASYLGPVSLLGLVTALLQL